jgi:transcriptional regulator with XRE-family HTH domain
MTRVRDLHEQWMTDPAYREAYEALAPEFELAGALIRARTGAGLTQAQLAEGMQTTQSVIARPESGRARPSTTTLERIAQATGTRLRISFERSNAGGRDASAAYAVPSYWYRTLATDARWLPIDTTDS